MPGNLSGIFGITSAISWGAGDFSGAIASKKMNSKNVVIFSQIFGFFLLVSLALITSEPYTSILDLVWGALSGISGAVGLVYLYEGLATGKMSVIAPISGILSVLIPFLTSLLLNGLPKILNLLGILVAFLAVWFLARSTEKVKVQVYDIKIGIIAGFGFGLFFVLIDQIQNDVIFWPLAVSRLISIILLILVTFLSKELKKPTLKQLPVISFAGIIDVGGNAFFVLSAQVWRLDIASALSSFYPAFTVLLSWLILGEKLSWYQFIGLILSLFAILLLTT